MQNQKDREEFLTKVCGAYQCCLGRNEKTQLLLAYQHDNDYKICGFKSHCQIVAERRGEPRRKKRRDGEETEKTDETDDTGVEPALLESNVPGPTEPMYLPIKSMFRRWSLISEIDTKPKHLPIESMARRWSSFPGRPFQWSDASEMVSPTFASDGTLCEYGTRSYYSQNIFGLL